MELGVYPRFSDVACGAYYRWHVTGVDVAQNDVTVLVGATGLDPSERHIKADHLIVALGSVTNFHHVPGVEENALQMKHVEDAGWSATGF